jgi:hypothetical protein
MRMTGVPSRLLVPTPVVSVLVSVEFAIPCVKVPVSARADTSTRCMIKGDFRFPAFLFAALQKGFVGIRSPMLYPAELRAHSLKFNTILEVWNR